MVGQILLAYGPYGPFLHSILSSRSTRESIPCRSMGTYTLWAVEDGGIVEQRENRIHFLKAPCAILLPPQAQGPYVITPRSRWRCLVFDVVFQERRPTKAWAGKRFGAFTHLDQDRIQPGPKEVWGFEPPIEVPSELVVSCLGMAKACNAIWWKDEWQYAQANYRLGRWLFSFLDRFRGQAEREAENWLDRLEGAVRERLEQGGMTVAAMARMVGMSRQHFHRLYHAKRGVPPSEFLFQLRMEVGTGLLDAADIPLAKVARACGFLHTSTFSTWFKAHKGLSPLAYRRRFGQG